MWGWDPEVGGGGAFLSDDMSGALEVLLALMLARVVEGGPGTTPGATAELTAGGPRQATHRNEAAAPHRASALRAVRGGAQSPFFPARGLPARGRPPGACGLCRPGAGSSSRLTSSRWVGAVSHRRGCPAGRRRPFRSCWVRLETVWRSRGISRVPQCSDVNTVSTFVAHLSREAARFRGGSQKKAFGGRCFFVRKEPGRAVICGCRIP